ncbi:helix-turn-helix domain-containing protein [Pedobacter nyackensis]|uniref:DNA-binding transcriptional regulator, XRE-family HTH domain n=1 Tax=Pedobacter nyackensis TaxID=475255 RepID=A0A1W2BLC2_9SPHI|nr:helix-turn-helix transcriptional regulator [Pedobacter nyackensis]SMC73737.1 DNA-binding transcriptional regulator, XRE-family HTH domain [Pedobacter nyackensis]
METTAKTNKVHIGRKISRIREIRGIKQDALATELGVSQQAISKIEQSEEVEDSTLEKIAAVLGVTIDSIKNFSEEGIVNYFNTFNDTSVNQGSIGSYNVCNFNPLEKVIELYNEKVELLERLLQSEREKIELLKGKS